MIDTPRLRLEPAAPALAQEWLSYSLRNRAYLAPWEPKRSERYFTLDAVVEELGMAMQQAQEKRGYRFAAFRRTGAGIIGIVNISNVIRGALQSANLGYSIDEAHQGNGYATELVKAAVAFAFEDLNLHRLETSYQPHNVASGRVLRKAGFGVEGYVRDRLFIDGAWSDSVMVGLTNERWRAEE